MNTRAQISEMVQKSADKINTPAPEESSISSEVAITPVVEPQSVSLDDSVATDTETAEPDVVVPSQKGQPVDWEKRLRDKELYAQEKANEAARLKQELELRDRSLQNLQLSLIQQQLQQRQAPPAEPEDLTDEQIEDRRMDAAVKRQLAALGLTNPSAINMVAGIGEWATFIGQNPEAAPFENLITRTLERFPDVKRNHNGFLQAWQHVQDLQALANASSTGSQGEAANAPTTKAPKAPLSAQRKEQLDAAAGKLAAAGETSAPVGAVPKRTVNKNAPMRIQIADMVASSFDKIKGNM